MDPSLGKGAWPGPAPSGCKAEAFRNALGMWKGGFGRKSTVAGAVNREYELLRMLEASLAA